MTPRIRIAAAAAIILSAFATPVQARESAPTPAVVAASGSLNLPTSPSASTKFDSFGTLAEAVDAHRDMAAATDQAVRCLAGAIYFESKGEPLAGQLAVAEVILNRTKSGRFPPDVCGVITQRGQFGFVRAGRIPAVDESCTMWRTAVAVARVAMADLWDSAATGALFFNTPDRRPASNIRRVATIGHHVFYR